MANEGARDESATSVAADESGGVSSEMDAAGSSSDEGVDWGSVFAVAGGATLLGGLAWLLSRESDDETLEDGPEITQVRLTPQIVQAFSEMTGFFEGDETLRSAKAHATLETVTRDAERLNQAWGTLSPLDQDTLAEMPILWQNIQALWNTYTEEGKDAVRKNWSPFLDDE